MTESKSEKLDKVEKYRIIVDSVKNVVTTDIIFRLDKDLYSRSEHQRFFCEYREFTVDADMQADIQDAVLNIYVKNFLNLFKMFRSEIEIGIDEPPFMSDSDETSVYESYVNNFDGIFVNFSSDSQKHKNIYDKIDIKNFHIIFDATHKTLHLSRCFTIPFSCQFLCENCFDKKYCLENYQNKKFLGCCTKAFNFSDLKKDSRNIFENFLYNEHIEKILKHFNDADFRKKIEQESEKISPEEIEKETKKTNFQNNNIIDVLYMPADYSYVYHILNVINDFEEKKYRYKYRKKISDALSEVDSIYTIPF